MLRDATSRPALEVLKLLDAAIFQLIVGNADAHGKNCSLLYGPEETVLAPLYDLMCTIAYPDVAPKLAMKIAELATIEDLKMAPWTQFAADTGLGGAFVRRRTAELAAALRQSSKHATWRTPLLCRDLTPPNSTALRTS